MSKSTAELAEQAIQTPMQSNVVHAGAITSAASATSDARARGPPKPTKTVVLPNEVVSLIFEALREGAAWHQYPMKSYTACALVCKQWYALVTPYKYKRLCPRTPDQETLEELCTFLTKNVVSAASVERLTFISFMWPSRTDILKAILALCSNITSVAMREAGTHAANLESLACLKDVPHLQRLSLYGYTLNDVKSTLPPLAGLKALSLQVFDFTPELGLTDYSPWPKLRELHLLGCIWAHDQYSPNQSYQRQLFSDFAANLEVLRVKDTPLPTYGLSVQCFERLTTFETEFIAWHSMVRMFRYTSAITKLRLCGRSLEPFIFINWYRGFIDVQDLTISCLRSDKACWIACNQLADPTWFPSLRKLPRLTITMVGEVDENVVAFAKQAGLDNWETRMGTQASAAEQAEFLIKEDHKRFEEGDYEYSEYLWPLGKYLRKP